MPRITAAHLVVIAAGLLALKLMVIWLEPRMAFFPLPGVQETPAAAGLPYVDVKIRTADGETLHAWWMEHPEPRAQVVFWHGNGGNLSLWLDALVALRRRGLSVLAADYRGYGASTGRPTERGLYRDAEAVTREFHARFRRPGRPVLYWGRSIGSTVAAFALSVQPPDGVVLESPLADVRSVLRGNPVLWALSFLSSYRFPTTRFLDGYGGPLLVMHGDADSIIPFEAGRRVFASAPTRRKVFAAIPGADHNDPYFSGSTHYWSAVDEFLAMVGGR